jgi:hypothetical protein
MACEAEGLKIGGCDLDAKLLGKFADKSALRHLIHFDLTAGKLPQPRERAPGRALAEEDASRFVEKHAGDDEGQRRLLVTLIGHER